MPGITECRIMGRDADQQTRWINVQLYLLLVMVVSQAKRASGKQKKQVFSPNQQTYSNRQSKIQRQPRKQTKEEKTKTHDPRRGQKPRKPRHARDPTKGAHGPKHTGRA